MANKLIGTNANQVPSNADLGTAAYMDEKEFLTSRGSSLTEVNKIIDITARAIFIYDTRKDTDGGAWRKRTQNTSWYNEDLNTNVRGSKREFPQVAVIVCGQQTTTIYDADSPDLPMWMHFDGTHMLQAATGAYPRTDIHALNGIMVGTAYTYCNAHINFILDQGDIYWNSGTRRMSTKGISERNTAQTYSNLSVYGLFSHHDGFGVDMKVLPNTPIDPYMGLPRPTIGIATGYNLQRINHKGYLAGVRSDSTGATRPFHSVAIMGNDMLGYNYNNGTVQRYPEGAVYSGTLDHTAVIKYNYTVNQGHSQNQNVSATLRANSDANHPTPIGNNGFVTTGSLGASLFRDGADRYPYHSSQTIKDHSVSYITSKYATGSLYGDVRCATLMDTQAGDLNQHTTQMVHDPGFESAHNFTTIQSSATVTKTTAAARDGTYGITVTSSGGSNIYAGRQITGLTVGRQYHFSVDYDNRNHQTGITLNTGWANSGTSIVGSNSLQASASGTWETLAGSFIATGTSVWINIYAQGTIYVDNLHLYEGVEDRSLIQKALAVYGNITRQAVAPGAELMSYSNFTINNYLQLKNTSNLQMNTDGWYTSFWFKTDTANTSYEGLVHFNTEHSTSDDGWQILFDPSSLLYSYLYGSHNDVNLATGRSYSDNEWHMLTLVIRPGTGGSVGSRTGGLSEVYIDGESLATSATDPGSFNNSKAFLTLGKWDGNTGTDYSFSGELALFTMGAGSPVGRDIKEKFHRERLMFRPNAKVTLYGNSDDVKACAYDEGTGKTYIGTGQSVSVFQDLIRVDYTDDGITTAVSAVNGMVIEE